MGYVYLYIISSSLLLLCFSQAIILDNECEGDSIIKPTSFIAAVVEIDVIPPTKCQGVRQRSKNILLVLFTLIKYRKSVPGKKPWQRWSKILPSMNISPARLNLSQQTSSCSLRTASQALSFLILNISTLSYNTCLTTILAGTPAFRLVPQNINFFSLKNFFVKRVFKFAFMGKFLHLYRFVRYY